MASGTRRVHQEALRNLGAARRGAPETLGALSQGNAAPGLWPARVPHQLSFPCFLVPGPQKLLNRCAMRHELTAETLARLILWALDQAMAGRPRPLRLRSAPAPTAPLVALIDYVSGFPCLWVTPFAFYGEQTAKLLQALDRCLQTGQLDEVECCLLHTLEPGRGPMFDWGSAHETDPVRNAPFLLLRVKPRPQPP